MEGQIPKGNGAYICKEMKRSGIRGGELKGDYNVLPICLFTKRRMHSYITCGTNIL